MVLSRAISTLPSIPQSPTPSLFTRSLVYLTDTDLGQAVFYASRPLHTRAVPLSQGTDRGEAGWSFQRAWDSNPYCLWGPGPGIFSCSLAQLSPALLDTSSGSSRSISPHSIRCPDLFSSLPCAAATKSRVLVSCGREQDTKGREDLGAEGTWATPAGFSAWWGLG